MSLPNPITTLFGRESAITSLVATLEGVGRCVTLTGLGGVGKTRLAIATAHALVARGWTVHYADVASAHGTTELALALAEALEVEPPVSRRVSSPLANVGAAVARRALDAELLVIDNFEHLLTPPAEVVLQALAAFMRSAPKLRLLVTSRVPLELTEEMVVPVEPIGSGELDSPAVQLLSERAAHVPSSPAWRQDGAALQRLASRLDGWPLALELVASRAHLVTPGEMLQLLDGLRPLVLAGHDARHASRDQVIEWSWNQLAPQAQDALRNLAVIEGSFDFELAALMLDPATRPPDIAVHESVDALLRVSLLSTETSAAGPRYRMFETVRDFVRRATGDEQRARANDVLADALLQRMPPQDERALFAGFDMNVVRAERDRLTAIIRRANDDPRPRVLEHALRAAMLMLLTLRRSGLGTAIADVTARLLARPDTGAVPLSVRLGAGNAVLVALASGQGVNEPDELPPLARRLDAWVAAEGDERQRALVLLARGIVHFYAWDNARLFEVAKALLASPSITSDQSLALVAQRMLTQARRALGLADFDEDDADAEREVALLTGLGDVHQIMLAQINRAYMATHLGRPRLALAMAEAAEATAGRRHVLRMQAIARRERARAESELGLRGVALATFDEALGPMLGSREWTEGLLDRSGLALEVGRYDEVRRDLDALAGTLVTTFDHGYAVALEHALAALVGRPAPMPILRWTGTVEDGAARAWCAIGLRDGARAQAIIDATRSQAPYSFRVRRALRVLEASVSLRAGDPSVMALAYETSAFRIGATWVDLTTKPRLAALLETLARAHLEGVPVVDKATLADNAWPDERLAPETRDRRLESALSALRKLGLDAIQAAPGGYRIDPALRVLRVAMSAWPSASGEVQRARARGRPKRVQP